MRDRTPPIPKLEIKPIFEKPIINEQYKLREENKLKQQKRDGNTVGSLDGKFSQLNPKLSVNPPEKSLSPSKHIEAEKMAKFINVTD